MIAAPKAEMDNAVKVLIVEDEPHALMGLAELISGWGYRTEIARDGIEGWEKAQVWNPAIVVTDLKMPCLPGWRRRTRVSTRIWLSLCSRRWVRSIWL
jgi:CheY-like chemotaxis protein